MAVSEAPVFPGFLTPVLTQLFFPKPPTTFFPCFCRSDRRKTAGKKVCLNLGSNSQPPGHESNTLTGAGHTALCIITTNTNAKFQVNQTGDDKVMLQTKNYSKELSTSNL